MKRIFLPMTEKSSADSHSRLTWARIVAGVTQTELARALGLSPAWVSGVEHGALIPTLQQKIEIARILEMDVETIFSEDEETED